MSEDEINQLLNSKGFNKKVEDVVHEDSPEGEGHQDL